MFIITVATWTHGADGNIVREEVLEQRFSEMLGRLRFDDEVLSWITEALKASRSEHAAHMKRHSAASVKNMTVLRLKWTLCMKIKSRGG